MQMPKVLDKLVHHHEKPHPAEPQEPQRESVDTEAPLNPTAEPTTAAEPTPEQPAEQLPTPPTESHHHGFLHKLAHPMEKKPHEGEPHHEKEHHHRLHHHHEDSVYAHHAVDTPAPASETTRTQPLEVSTETPPADKAATPPHQPSSPLHKGWEKIKKIAHDHHENANESFDGYYGAMTEGATATAPDRRASAEAGPSVAKTEEQPQQQPHETKEHAVERLGAAEREKHQKEHTMGYGVAAV